MARSRASDPVRNFKFHVDLDDADHHMQQAFNKIGFMTLEGIAMNTEMVPYREGGWNTNPHKLPGQSDFAPLTMSAGVFYVKPGMWRLAQRMFAVQWGSGTLGFKTGQFRFDMSVRIMDHPVTMGAEAKGISGSVMGFKFFNCWAASIGFNGLNAMENAIMVHQMTVHHEGFDTFFDNEAVSLTHIAAGRASSIA
jgi:phage tail-like protein